MNTMRTASLVLLAGYASSACSLAPGARLPEPVVSSSAAIADELAPGFSDNEETANHDMAVAVARAQQAREAARIARAAFLPTIRARASIDDFSSPTNAGIGAQLQELGLSELLGGATDDFTLPDRLGLTTVSLGADFAYELEFWGRADSSRLADGAAYRASPGGRCRCPGNPTWRWPDSRFTVRSDVAVQQVEILRIREEARIARAQYEAFRRRRADGAPAADAGPLALWQPQLEAAQAVLGRHAAELADAELALSRTEVRAPFDGVVRVESLDAGQLVAAGESVGRLYASGAVEVVVPLPDADAALVPDLWSLRAGDADRRIPVRVVAEHGVGRYAWPGYADRVETALDEQTRTLDVIVRVPRPFTAGVPADARDGGTGRGGSGSAPSGGPPLLLGMFVEVEIQGIAPDTYFRVRRPALRPGDEVWVVAEAGWRLSPCACCSARTTPCS